MSIYNNAISLFTDLIEYNESNMEYMGSLQIPMTNIYYITFCDSNDTKINEFILYLNNFEQKNPFETIKVNMNIDSEQICNINLVKSTLQQINKELTETLNNASESNSKISIILDINMLFHLIKSFKEKESEIHLYDFILHILKKKVDKLFILDTKNILKNEKEEYSSIYNELIVYLLKERKSLNLQNKKKIVTIYKGYNSLYWKILDLNKRITYLDSEDQETKIDEDISLVEINDEEALLTTIPLSKICYSNLFEMHSFVLDPIDKLNIYT
jgi:hypothetical protein